MFCSSLSTLETDRLVLHQYLVRALEYLASKNFSAVAPGRYDIDGDDMFALVQEYRTQPKSAKKAEAHRRFIDIQFVGSGAEIIGFAPAGAPAEICKNYSADKDAVMFTKVSDETDLILAGGMYAILFPGEIHRPQCAYGSEALVKKIVIKAAITAIR